MICSDNSRCKKFNLIEFDNNFGCKNCNAIFNKPYKIVINCYKKRFINRKSNISYCKNLFVDKCFLKNYLILYISSYFFVL